MVVFFLILAVALVLEDVICDDDMWASDGPS